MTYVQTRRHFAPLTIGQLIAAIGIGVGERHYCVASPCSRPVAADGRAASDRRNRDDDQTEYSKRPSDSLDHGHIASGGGRYGLVAVIAWIGALKMTAYEARGIKPFVANTPLMSWLYEIFTVNTFSALWAELRSDRGLWQSTRSQGSPSWAA